MCKHLTSNIKFENILSNEWLCILHHLNCHYISFYKFITSKLICGNEYYEIKHDLQSKAYDEYSLPSIAIKTVIPCFSEGWSQSVMSLSQVYLSLNFSLTFNKSKLFPFNVVRVCLFACLFVVFFYFVFLSSLFIHF